MFSSLLIFRSIFSSFSIIFIFFSDSSGKSTIIRPCHPHSLQEYIHPIFPPYNGVIFVDPHLRQHFISLTLLSSILCEITSFPQIYWFLPLAFHIQGVPCRVWDIIMTTICIPGSCCRIPDELNIKSDAVFEIMNRDPLVSPMNSLEILTCGYKGDEFKNIFRQPCVMT